VEPLQKTLDRYGNTYEQLWCEMVTAKLGLPQFDVTHDRELFDGLFEALQVAEIDMTVFFRRLARIEITEVQGEAAGSDKDLLEPLADAFYDVSCFTGEARTVIEAWFDRYRQRVLTAGETNADRQARMDAVNPEYVLRNYLAQQAIDTATAGDFSMVDELLEVLREPYVEQSGCEKYAAKRPEWARNRPGCSTLSCSS